MVAVAALVVAALYSWFGVAEASGGWSAGGSPAAVMATTTTSPRASDTTERLPGTTLEAEARDDGTSPAPWFIGSGIAAAAAIAVGGTILKRRTG